uniref:Solute carrier family 23 member 2 n=1 Tax=Panagrellus redivivus TaxID=6233 RepID=A0A7E4ULX2_PANRE
MKVQTTLPDPFKSEKVPPGNVRSSVDMSACSEPDNDCARKLHFRAGDVPQWKQAILLAFQQTMICISGVLVLPYLVSEIACAGVHTIALRVKLISATFVVTGITTVLQTVFGLRLAILQGPSFAFLPPLYAFANLPEMRCKATMNDYVPYEQYSSRIESIQGSLAVAAVLLIVLGSTGLIGTMARHVGPLTICPLLTLLCLGNVPVILEKASLHWISLVQFGLLMLFVMYLAETTVPIPYISERRIKIAKYRLFGLFPYLLSILIAYGVCLVLTLADLIPADSPARIDKEQSMNNLRESPWFQVPYPGQFGVPSINLGLLLGMLASCVACTIESLGAYGILAKVSNEKPPPSSSLNRAIVIEGIGSVIAGFLGVGVGITTYSENVAAVSITRVASRFTMQLAGGILICLGIFTKVGAVMATIPDPMVGGMLAMGVCMIAGVGFGNLEFVDIKLSRNLTIMGTSVILGMVIPDYFTEHPVATGNLHIDQMLNILLTIRMFVGGLIAFFLDNTIGGATREQRGFRDEYTSKDDNEVEADGYAFPERINSFLIKNHGLCKFPFMPSMKRLQATSTTSLGSA